MEGDGTPSRAVDPGAFYRGMFQHPDIAFFVIEVSPDGDYLIEDGNKALENWLGVTIEQMKGRPVREWLAPPGIDFLESNLRIAIAKRDSHSYDRAVELADGALSWSTTLIPVIEGDGPVRHVLGMVRDVVHEREKSGGANHDPAAVDPGSRLVEALHETIGQHLAAAHLALMRLEIFAAPHASDRGKELDEALGDAKAAIDEIKREIGVVAYVLRPPAFDGQGFGDAVRTFAEGFGRRSRIAIGLSIAPEAGDLPLAASMPLFRVLQEALANVHRHARAKEVAIALDVANGAVVMMVADDGVGFGARPASAAALDGSGLAAMRERMAQLGGSFEVKRQVRGATIVAKLPLE